MQQSLKSFFSSDSKDKRSESSRQSWAAPQHMRGAADRGSATKRSRSGHKQSPSTHRSESSNAEARCIDTYKQITLSYRQRAVIEAIMSRKTVFFTGAAGTGKSHILNILRDTAEVLGISDKIAFTAPTGVAACNIRGLTLHSWSGIGLGTEPLERLAAQVARSSKHRNRWLDTQILVIDEISMLSAELFDVLSKIGSRVRGNSLPFGGLQLVLCGDFFQLPPIGLGRGKRLCFRAESWSRLFSDDGTGSVVLLRDVFRQKERHFLNVLHELRRGELSKQTMQLLSDKVIEGKHEETTKEGVATKLFGTNRDVHDTNTSELAKLESESIEFNCRDWGEDRYLKQLRGGTKFPDSLELKVGAEVMLLKNLSVERGLVNGARGVVKGFEWSRGRSEVFDHLPEVEFRVRLGDGEMSYETMVIKEEVTDIQNGGRVLATRTQLPLMLAYAITIHKSQGMTIPNLEVSFKGMFEYGQAYVALSRATDLEGLRLSSFDPRTVRALPEVRMFYASLESAEKRNVEGDEKRCTTSISDLSALYRSSPNPSFADPGVDEEGWISKKSKPSITSSSVVAYDDFMDTPVDVGRYKVTNESIGTSMRDCLPVSQEKPPPKLRSSWDARETTTQSHLRSIDPNRSIGIACTFSTASNMESATLHTDSRGSASSESLSLDQKRKIEENRQAAMQKLKKSREERNLEMEKLLSASSPLGML